jgi:hypothetical protein
VETGAGNAAVGAYLANLGYSLDLVLEVTKASPYEMTLLTPALARRIGLAVEWIAPEASPHAPDRPTPPREAEPSFDLESQAVAFVERHLRWLGESPEVPAAVIEDVYAPVVDFYGERIARAEVRRRQSAYARRWPVHRLTPLRPPLAWCRDGRCVVRGDARFHGRSEVRNRISEGTVSYAFVLEWRNGRFRIVSESNAVVDGESRPIRVAQVRLTRQIQAELNRLGCDPGPIDGVWGPQTAAALARFHRANHSAGTAGSATERDLAIMKSVRGVICRR